MRIRPENTTRKIDALGRVTIPKGLRDRMGLHENDDMELFTMESGGREYICLCSAQTEDAIIGRIEYCHSCRTRNQSWVGWLIAAVSIERAVGSIENWPTYFLK